MSIVAVKLAELQVQLDNHASRSTPAEELHLLLATGALSPALHHFLIVILGQLSPGSKPATQAAIVEQCCQPDTGCIFWLSTSTGARPAHIWCGTAGARAHCQCGARMLHCR